MTSAFLLFIRLLKILAHNNKVFARLLGKAVASTDSGGN